MCGDPFDMNPQPHADGGKYSNGIIAKTYTKGQVIDVHVQVVVSHKGKRALLSRYFCPEKVQQSDRNGIWVGY